MLPIRRFGPSARLRSLSHSVPASADAARAPAEAPAAVAPAPAVATTPNVTRRALVQARFEELHSFSRVDRSHRPFPVRLRDRVSSLLLQQHYSKREANRKPSAATAATRVATIRNKLEPVSPEEVDAKPVTPAEQLNKLYPLQTSLKYVADEMPLSFAAQRAVFLEVQKRMPGWAPGTVLDFGAGPGTSLWAALDVWPSASKSDGIRTYTAVEPAEHMNKLGMSLTAGVSSDGLQQSSSAPFESFASSPAISATSKRAAVEVSWRNSIPEQLAPHNMTVAAYSLSELSTAKDRRATLTRLWALTTDVLVIIERGTAPGFQLVLEARDYLLNRFPPASTAAVAASRQASFVLAPCPHDGKCMFARSNSDSDAAAPLKAARFCNFTASLQRATLPGRSSLQQSNFAGQTSIPSAFGASIDATERSGQGAVLAAASSAALRSQSSPDVITPYSYVVLRKGPSPRLQSAKLKIDQKIDGWYPTKTPRDLVPSSLVGKSPAQTTPGQADEPLTNNELTGEDSTAAGRAKFAAYFADVAADASKLLDPAHLAHYMARVVLPPQKRKGHVRLDLCTSGSGEWQRHIMSRSKAGTLGYRAARKAHWGDMWPFPTSADTDQTPRYQPTASEQKAIDAAAEARAQEVERQTAEQRERSEEIKSLETSLHQPRVLDEATAETPASQNAPSVLDLARAHGVTTRKEQGVAQATKPVAEPELDADSVFDLALDRSASSQQAKRKL